MSAAATNASFLYNMMLKTVLCSVRDGDSIKSEKEIQGGIPTGRPVE
jgi:hypothetical protein